MNIEDISVVKAGFGTVLVRPIRDNSSVQVGPSKVYLDTSYQKEKHSINYGEVVSVCESIPSSLRTTIEARVGDVVFFHYNCIINAIRDKKLLACNNQAYYAVPYESLYMAKRGEEIICLNGFILVTPKMEHSQDRIGQILLPECMMAIEQVSRGRIAYLGSPLNGEKHVVLVGDDIIFRKSSAVSLEYDLHQSLGRKYFRMKSASILATSQNDTSSGKAQLFCAEVSERDPNLKRQATSSRV